MPSKPSKLSKYNPHPNSLSAIHARFDIANLTSGLDPQRKFETAAMIANEDRTRGKLLQASTWTSAQVLAEECLAAAEGRYVARNVAVKAYAGVIKRWHVGQLLEVVYAHFLGQPVYGFTIIPSEWRKARLKDVTGEEFLRTFRAWLRKIGVLDADGMCFAVLHAEFDGEAHQFHLHGIVIGEKAALLNRLKEMPELQRTSWIYFPVRIEAIPLGDPPVDLAYWLTYCLQFSWAAYPRFMGRDGKLKKPKWPRRLPGKHHTRMLLWLARQRMSHLIFMNGLRIRRVNGRRKLVRNEF